MGMRNVWDCDCCGCCITDDEECGYVAYVVVAPVRDGYHDIDRMSDFAAAMAALPDGMARRNLCMRCLAERFTATDHEVDEVLTKAEASLEHVPVEHPRRARFHYVKDKIAKNRRAKKDKAAAAPEPVAEHDHAESTEA